LTTDQRGVGFLRISSGTVDMGACEAQLGIASYVAAANAPAASVFQNGTNTVVFLNEHGTFVLGTRTSATQVTVAAWGNDVADFSNPGKVQWSDGSVWSLSVTAAPQFTVTDYTAGPSALQSHVIRNDTTTAVFVNEHGSFVLGNRTSTTQATVAAWGNDVATISAGKINWSDGSVWNLLNAASPQVTNYTPGGSAQTASVIQNGTNTVVFLNEHGAFALGTWTSTTQATVAAWGNDVATFSANKITWSDGSIWNLSTTAPPHANVIGFAAGGAAINAHVGQEVFLNEHGSFVLGTWTGATQATVSAWGNDVATFGGGMIHWSDGSVWNSAAQVTVADYSIGSGTAHVIRNGTRTVVFVNEAGSVALGTMTDSIHATVPIWGNDVATFFDDHIQWSDGSAWTSAAVGNQVTVANYTNRGNGLLTHVVRNGTNTLVFINEAGAVVLGMLTDSTHATVGAWGNDVATFANGQITWSDGSVWF
jgi:hypothetical protein